LNLFSDPTLGQPANKVNSSLGGWGCLLKLAVDWSPNHREKNPFFILLDDERDTFSVPPERRRVPVSFIASA
jgi:hypothetical protein